MTSHHKLVWAALICLAAVTGAAGQAGGGAAEAAPGPAAEDGTLSRQQFLTFCVPMWQPLSICDPAQPSSEYRRAQRSTAC